MNTPTFVVGTGRCGSTMLSNMLRDHPHVLSLSEFFTSVSDFWSRIPEVFSQVPIDGRQFWAIVAAMPSRMNFAFRHGCAPETLYPSSSSAARFSALTGVPAILHTTLPHLTEDHDRLFDMLENLVTQWPRARIEAHYQRLFGWLADRFGKRLWVERSGSTFGMIEQLLSAFPEAKIVHIVRDGRDVAMSMQQHMGFRFGFVVVLSLAQYLGVDPIESADRTCIDRVPGELRAFLPESFNAEALRTHHIPLSLCAEFWVQQMVGGLGALRSLPEDRLLTLRYEDFFIDARTQLAALTTFLGDEYRDEVWSNRCATTIHKPRSSWRDLSSGDARALMEVCRPGFTELAAAGVHYAT